MAGPPPPQKLCPSCGASVPADANLCANCGYNFNTGPYAQPPPPGFGSPNPPGSSPNWQTSYPRSDFQSNPGSADGFAIASLVLGILSILLFCFWCLAVPCAALALIFGALGLKGRNRALAIGGMICAGLAILLTIGLVVLAVTGGFVSRSGSDFPWR